MKEEEQKIDYCCNCKLLRKFEKTGNVYSFLNETCPLLEVMENLDKISPENLRCICCLYCNSLYRLYPLPLRKRIKRHFIPFLEMSTHIPFIGKYIDKII